MILQLYLIKKKCKKSCNCRGGGGVESSVFDVFDLQLSGVSIDLSPRLLARDLEVKSTVLPVSCKGNWGSSFGSETGDNRLHLTGRSVDLNGKNAWYLTARVTPNTPNLLGRHCRPKKWTRDFIKKQGVSPNDVKNGW